MLGFISILATEFKNKPKGIFLHLSLYPCRGYINDINNGQEFPTHHGMYFFIKCINSDSASASGMVVVSVCPSVRLSVRPFFRAFVRSFVCPFICKLLIFRPVLVIYLNIATKFPHRISKA